MIESRRETADKCEREFRFYITSLGADAKRLGDAVPLGHRERPALGDGHGLP